MSRNRINIVLPILTVLILMIILVINNTFINYTFAQSNNNSNEQVIVKEQKLPKEAKQAPLKMTSCSFGRDRSEVLKGFAVEVKNTSDKPIYYARYALVVSSEGSKGIFFPIFYNPELSVVEDGKPFPVKREALEVGAITTLRVSDKDALVLARYLKENNLGRVNKIELILQVVHFNEQDFWVIGQEDTSEKNKQEESEKAVEINKNPSPEQAESSCSTCSGSCGDYTSTLCFPQSYCSETVVNRAYTRTGREFARPSLYVYLCQGQNGTVVSHVLCQLTSCATQN